MFALYKFELRKINSRKIVWITGCVMLVGLLIWGVASAVLPQSREYSDSSLNGYEANRAEREAAELISGRAIDQTLIDEMRPAYENFIFNGNYREICGIQAPRAVRQQQGCYLVRCLRQVNCRLLSMRRWKNCQSSRIIV